MLFVSHVLLVGITLVLKNEEVKAILKKSSNFKGYVNKDVLMKLIDVINENEGDRTNVDKEFKALGLTEPNYLSIMKHLQKNYDYKEMADIKDKTEARIHIIENPEVLNEFLAELDRKDEPTPEDLPRETKSHRRRGNFRARRRHLFRRRHHNRRHNSKRRNISGSKHHEKRFSKYSRENDGGKKKRFERRDRFGKNDREDSRENNKEKTIDKKDKYRGYSKENNNDKKKRPYDSKWSDKKDKNVGYSRENDNKKKRIDDSKWFDKKSKYTDYSRENDNNKKKKFDEPKRFGKKDRADSKEKFSKKEQLGDKVNVREKYDVKNKFDDRKKRSDSREKKTVRSRVDDYDYNNGVATTRNAFRESILTVDLASIEENIKIPVVDSYYPKKTPKTKDWLDFENRKPLDKVKNDDDWDKPMKNDNNWDKPIKNDDNWDKPIKNNDNWDKPIKNNDNWDKPIKNNDNWDKPIKNNDNWDKPIKNNDNWDKPIKNNDNWDKPIKNNDNWGKPIKADDNWGKPMNDMANPGAPMPQNDLDWGERVDVKIINPPIKSYEDDMEKGGQERFTAKDTRDFFNKYASTTKSQNNDWGRPAVKYENKYKYNMERLYDYEYQPKRKPINRDGYGFGRTPIPYIGKKGVYAEN